MVTAGTLSVVAGARRNIFRGGRFHGEHPLDISWCLGSAERFPVASRVGRLQSKPSIEIAWCPLCSSRYKSVAISGSSICRHRKSSRGRPSKILPRDLCLGYLHNGAHVHALSICFPVPNYARLLSPPVVLSRLPLATK